VLASLGEGNPMRKAITFIVITSTIALLLSACESNVTPHKTSSSSARTIDKSALVTNAWSAPAKLGEWATKDFIASSDFTFTSAVGGSFIAGWANADLQAQFTLRSALGGPWQPTGPNLAGFKKEFPPHLYTNPRSSAVYATWYSPDVGRSGNFISRYTADAGWTTPHAFSDTVQETKVIVGDNGEAVILWESFAENGTMELNARRVDLQGNLSLMDTYILGQPGRLAPNLSQITGTISASGAVNIFGLSQTATAPDPFFPSSSWQLWNINYSASGALSKTWSKPQIIPNTDFTISGYPQQVDIVPAGATGLRIFIKSGEPAGEKSIAILESNNGVWSNITLRLESPTYGSLVAPIATSPSGQIAIAWLDYTFAQDVDKNSTIEFRVFVKHYNDSTGWSAPVQINNSLPQPAEGVGFGTGDEPKISINSAGQIAVVWRNPADKPAALYSNFYDPATQWRGEELAVTTAVKKEYLPKFEVMLADTGDTSIIWQETKFGLGGITTVTLQAVDHLGAGNGVAKTKSANIQAVSKNALSRRIGLRTAAGAPARSATPSLTTRQRIARQSAIANPLPVRASSAWNEPTVLGEFMIASDQGYFVDALNVNSNDRGESLVSYLVDPSNETTLVWSGNIVTGGWQKDSPPFSPTNGTPYVMDTVVDPQTGNLNLGWLTMCSSNECGDIFVSSKLSDGSWEAPTSLGKSVFSGLDLLVSSKGIGAAWYAAQDAAGNPTIAYSGHSQGAGWAPPDLFTPTVNKTLVGPLGHSPSRVMSAVLGESGVVSIVADVSFGNASVLVQRNPSGAWTQADFPIPVATTSTSPAYLTATGTGDSVQALVDEGFSSLDRREMAYQYSNGNWGTPLDVTAPKKGDIYTFGIDKLPKDSNSKGQVLAAWSEQVFVGADPTRQVRVNWFDPVLGWGKPIDIGYPISGYVRFQAGRPSDIVENLQVNINESGQGAVAWIDTSGTQHTLNIVHLNLAMTEVTHEIVRSVDPAVTAFSALDVHVDNQGRTILVWDETTFGLNQDTHRVKTATYHAGGTISPGPVVPPVITTRPVPVVPPVSIGWSNKEVAWTFPVAPGWMDLSQPATLVIVNDQPILGIQVDRAFDTTTERFASSDHTLVSGSASGVWTSNDPFGAVAPDVMTSVQMVTDEKAQALYALWISQHALYINRQNSNGTWTTPLLVASNVDSGLLLINGNGQVAALWELIGDPSALQVAEVTAGAGNTIRVGATATSTVTKSARVGRAVLSNLGTIAVMREITNITGQDFVISKYEFGKGWQAQSTKKITMNGFSPANLQLAITSTNQVVAFAQSDTLRTLHSASLKPDGTWSAWTSIQNGNGNPISLAGQYRVGTSSAGHLYAMWVEEIIRADGEPVNNAMFSSYGVPDAVTGSPWKSPNRITQISHPNSSETPLLLVGRDGAAAVVWKQAAVPFESGAIMVMKYQPTSGWKTEPETAASYASFFSPDLVRINAAISASNGLYIVWETPGDYSFFGPQPPYTVQMTRGKL